MLVSLKKFVGAAAVASAIHGYPAGPARPAQGQAQAARRKRAAQPAQGLPPKRIGKIARSTIYTKPSARKQRPRSGWNF